ncbi:MAG TPA: FKBP-type peptidyl-prolyl cis-trans isomerase [Sulfuricurvum sp.]|nr:MAG: peptidylprolyl isomerase [Campylobacterales bacterium 16-40-21]OZA04294.1 MAG: peptidylprolyl isomerase [Sulfuricurvum sp. 17-40-25]HQS66311.1 FKBP-type peptidyl-prolyl cis-trans isomerase [Sulfuricurvum sp.]HQT35730.1 FKBP-type peptidyl-prolyl cis-trans isomerase [Sulfuricurvum sp.]
MLVTKNCIVTIDYHINDTEGNLLHEEKESLSYLHGDYGQLFNGVEEALEGKKVGDTFKVALSSDQTFGEYDPELLVTENISELPADLHVGMEIDGYMEDDDEDVIIYTVKEIKGKKAIMDGNHPLAGMDLVFEGTVLDIHEADAKTIQEVLENDTYEV